MKPIKRHSTVFLLSFMTFIFALSSQSSSNDMTAKFTIEQFDMMPLAFTENHGQWDDCVKFRANARGATMWYTTDGVYYQFTRRIPKDNTSLAEKQRMPCDRADIEPDSIEQLMIRASFVGANPDPAIVGHDKMGYKCNYFIGNDPDEWHTDVPNYKAVVFKDVYAGIDLKYYGNGMQMEYDFIVSPGADPNQIMVQYDGAESISVNDEGELVVETDWGTVTEMRPYVYQLDASGCIPIQGRYVLFTDNTFGFDLGDRYNPVLALVIDPVLSYSTYVGGIGTDKGYGIAVDGSGSAYVTGFTFSNNFPTLDPYQTAQESIDAFVTKLSSSGSSLEYSTYLGGGEGEEGYGIAVDGSGAAYVTGWTNSTDFPTHTPYQTDQVNEDAFVTKLSSSGNSLVYSTYLGGGSWEYGYGIAVDGSGSAYVTGVTGSEDYPALNPYQTYQGIGDAFVTKFSSSGDCLAYSTFIGGSKDEQGHGIAVDGSGSAYVTGYTYSTDFPTLNPYQTDQAGYDAFVTKLTSSGNNLVYSTYLGGNSSDDHGYCIAVDDSGAAFVAGITYSTDFPTLNPYQTDQDEADAFVTKLSSSGNNLVYSTYLGGNSADEARSIVVDSSGAACVTGWTLSYNFPTLNPHQTNQSGMDAYVTMLSSSGSSLQYSSYLGGNSHDYGYGIAMDSSGAVYVAGFTESDDFPTVNPYQTDQDLQDVFVTKLSGMVSFCGDTDGSGFIDLDDVVYLIAYIFTGGPPPVPLEVGDADCLSGIDLDDVVYLIAYIFIGGPPPCDPDGDEVPDC